MTRWPIERSWVVLDTDKAKTQFRSTELREFRACALLGAAGLGKTYELRQLAELDQARGHDVRFQRLASLGQTEAGLEARLTRLANGATENTVFYLDAIDEVMVPVRTAGLIVERWIRDVISSTRSAVRISCRSAVWPSSLNSAIRDTFGEKNYVTALLRALADDDVRTVAIERKISPDKFMAAVETANVSVLAQQPLTLIMLLLVFEKSGTLPTRRMDLFSKGISILAAESAERRDDGTAIDVPLVDVLEACEQLACYTLLSGREIIDLSGSPDLRSLGEHELTGLANATRRLDSNILRAVMRCGLCEREGPHQFRFGHRQFAEYLAGRRIATLPLHQARALLASGLGWQAGVAGPLRETASFAAMGSKQVAGWIAEHDPEVIGLSDVADDGLRRRATRNLLEKFRRHELTDTHVGRDSLEWQGFRYAGAERDLGPILRERKKADCEDVLECAIQLIDSWELSGLSDELASLILDSSRPMQVRISAGHVLAKVGDSKSKRRLLPLLKGAHDDSSMSLKGLGLLCNWPGSITVAELLAAIPVTSGRLSGPLQSFLYSLDQDQFDAREDRLAGLRWAQGVMRRGADYEPTVRMVKRIAISALSEIENPVIAKELARLILNASAAYAGSPLVPPQTLHADKEPAPIPILRTLPDVRRKLIDALAATATAEDNVWGCVHETAGFLSIEDFSWLIGRATTTTVQMTQRTHYADLARLMPWQERAECVEAWYLLREKEPILSKLRAPLSVEMDSEEATKEREAYAERKKWSSPRPKKKLPTSPATRVEETLVACETRDPRFFYNLCRELTLEMDSTEYGISQLLKDTIGWSAASLASRDRVVAAAKKLLFTDDGAPAYAENEPLSSTRPGHITALWLVMEEDSSWVESLSDTWWKKWSWHLLREIPHMYGKTEVPKQRLFAMLYSKVPSEVNRRIEGLAKADKPDTKSLLESLLRLLDAIENTEIDELLSRSVENGSIPEDRVGVVAEFVLSRNSKRGFAICSTCLQPEALVKGEAVAIRSAIALLHTYTDQCWRAALDFITRRPNLAEKVLEQFSYGRKFYSKREESATGISALRRDLVGEMIDILLRVFTPETDPIHPHGGPNFNPSHSPRGLREQLITWLGDQRDVEAVEALRTLENKFGKKYPWLRRPRSQAERAYRLSRWEPTSPEDVAATLGATSKRLIRNGRDAVEGIVAAIDDYERRLHTESPSGLEDLWNITRGKRPTPKDEERVSDKICMAIRDYFQRFAVIAGREAQVSRRKLAANLNGAPGSEVDVLCLVPPSGAANGEEIAIPIEVKRSHNSEARSGLNDQLVNRYMRELGTDLGVFVVAWMGRDARAGYRPLWPSLEEARTDLSKLCEQSVAAANGSLQLRALVLNASLLVTSKTDKGRATKSKQPKTPRSNVGKNGGSKVATRPIKTVKRPKSKKRRKQSR